jgi:hypothetical protein
MEYIDFETEIETLTKLGEWSDPIFEADANCWEGVNLEVLCEKAKNLYDFVQEEEVTTYFIYGAHRKILERIIYLAFGLVEFPDTFQDLTTANWNKIVGFSSDIFISDPSLDVLGFEDSNQDFWWESGDIHHYIQKGIF